MSVEQRTTMLEDTFEWSTMLMTQTRSLALDAGPALVEVATVEPACGFPSPSQDYQRVC